LFGGELGGEQQWAATGSIAFDQSGMPTAFLVPRYMQAEGDEFFVAEVSQVGDSVSLTRTLDDGFEVTLDVTVALATYTETDARVVLNLQHHGDYGVDGNGDPVKPFSTQDGTGIEVIEYSLAGDQLTYYSQTTYEVAFINANIETTWQLTCEGTLLPQ